MEKKTDFLIIGSGIAGLSLAIKLGAIGRVVVITKKGVQDTATNWAQGGIACVAGPDDSFDLHEYDTLKAGDGLSHEEVVRMIVEGGPDRIRELASLGLEFSIDQGRPDSYDLGKEGGHSRRRVVHAGDITGRVIQKTLTERASVDPNIEILENHIAVDLVTEGKIRSGSAKKTGERCLGAYVLDVSTGIIHTILAPVTVLATGGAGKVYLYTTNPDVATGDGIAMAYRAGARVANLEFVQFHPTCLYHPQKKNFLISEALRGEGARLIDWYGVPFMEKYAPVLKELANRDVVARAIDIELKKSGKEHVYLDISHRDPDFVRRRFPNIYETCLKLGIDITREPIPVVPAAHYMCGGVVTNRYGETDLKGLFAVGETACTGLHGANRLASNSLLEGLVMSHQAFLRISATFQTLKKMDSISVPPWDPGGAVDMDEAILVSHNWDEIRRLMWNYVGIVRSAKRLRLAGQRIKPILREINQHYWDYILTSDFVELRNIAQVADLIIMAASARFESRGGHFILDNQEKDDWNWRRDTILRRSKGDPSL
ncbi:MAG: L-aspartate oxidase [Dissulfurimicrobium sp.]|uniref:L-aspartate oxidase n=1 Tax=Dissulfurimicrobium TaxID=1769732 RepID=UPI001EDC92D8|nr:L-aspartate oxidase [Dissulfurimicrobium hydrothermale]UKL13978.1 L-aspartate oxidase [Dissulfurimicrobium hydrothermale]